MLIALHAHIIDCFDTTEACGVMHTEITEATVAATLILKVSVWATYISLPNHRLIILNFIISYVERQNEKFKFRI